MLSPMNKSSAKNDRSKFSEGVSPGTKVVLELLSELDCVELSVLSVLVKTTSVELLDSVIELLVDEETLDETELDDSIKG